MPSPIIHLEVIFNLCQRMNYPIIADLLLGSISPDAIHMRENQTWQDKSKTHFYETADHDFDEAIQEAKKVVICSSSEFKLGYLIHLYTDYLWRERIYTPFFLARKDVMIREELHALYYKEMKAIDGHVLDCADWVNLVKFELSKVRISSCFPLLNHDEVQKWCDKVIEKDLNTEVTDYELKVFFTEDIQLFINHCSEELMSRFEMFKS